MDSASVLLDVLRLMINPLKISEADAVNLFDGLSFQQQAVAKMVAAGFQAPYIAGILNISASTVRKHREIAARNMGVHNSYGLAAIVCVAVRAKSNEEAL